jgi:hypothetical protein
VCEAKKKVAEESCRFRNPVLRKCRKRVPDLVAMHRDLFFFVKIGVITKIF